MLIEWVTLLALILNKCVLSFVSVFPTGTLRTHFKAVLKVKDIESILKPLIGIFLVVYREFFRRNNIAMLEKKRFIAIVELRVISIHPKNIERVSSI